MRSCCMFSVLDHLALSGDRSWYMYVLNCSQYETTLILNGTSWSVIPAPEVHSCTSCSIYRMLALLSPASGLSLTSRCQIVGFAWKLVNPDGEVVDLYCWCIRKDENAATEVKMNVCVWWVVAMVRVPEPCLLLEGQYFWWPNGLGAGRSFRIMATDCQHRREAGVLLWVAYVSWQMR